MRIKSSRGSAAGAMQGAASTSSGTAVRMTQCNTGKKKARAGGARAAVGRPGSVQVGPQGAGARGMLQALQGLFLDLPDALLGQFVAAADLLQGHRPAAVQPEAVLDDVGFLLAQGVQHLV